MRNSHASQKIPQRQQQTFIVPLVRLASPHAHHGEPTAHRVWQGAGPACQVAWGGALESGRPYPITCVPLTEQIFH